jgi:hypothetical protein
MAKRPRIEPAHPPFGRGPIIRPDMFPGPDWVLPEDVEMGGEDPQPEELGAEPLLVSSPVIEPVEKAQTLDQPEYDGTNSATVDLPFSNTFQDMTQVIRYSMPNLPVGKCLSVTLNPLASASEDDANNILQRIAAVEFGHGRFQSAVGLLNVDRGLTFSVPGSYISIRACYSRVAAITPPPRLGAYVSVGEPSRHFPLNWATLGGLITAGTVSGNTSILPFVRAIEVLTSQPDIDTYRVEFVTALGQNVYSAYFTPTRPVTPIRVATGSVLVRVRNMGAADITSFSIVQLVEL